MLERDRDKRRRYEADAGRATMKTPIDMEAVDAVLDELLDAAPGGREAALREFVDAIPKCLRGTPATGGR